MRYIHVCEHFEQVHMFWRAPGVHSALKYCRHACIVGVCDMRALSQQTPSVDKEQSFIVGFRCFKRWPLQSAFQISQCRSLICELLVQLCSVRSDTCYALMHCGTSFMVKSRDRVAHSKESALLFRNAVFLVASVSSGHWTLL